MFAIQDIERVGEAQVRRELEVGRATHEGDAVDAFSGGTDYVWVASLSEGDEAERFRFFRPKRLGAPDDEELTRMIQRMSREFQSGRSALEQFRMRRQPHAEGWAILLPY